jgi:hypothetical protein
MTNWVFTDYDFKQILARNNDVSNEELSVQKTKGDLIPHLQSIPCWSGLSPQILRNLRKAKTFHSINRAIDLLYDYADSHKIWLGFIA